MTLPAGGDVLSSVSGQCRHLTDLLVHRVHKHLAIDDHPLAAGDDVDDPVVVVEHEQVGVAADPNSALGRSPNTRAGLLVTKDSACWSGMPCFVDELDVSRHIQSRLFS